MERLNLAAVIRTIADLTLRRFSTLTAIELQGLWTEIGSYLGTQLLLKKSIRVPGLGTFFERKSLVNFYPCNVWELAKSNNNFPHGAIESMHLTTISEETGLHRDIVEAGLKDILLFVTKALKRGAAVTLSLGRVGHLHFKMGSVKFRPLQSFYFKNVPTQSISRSSIATLSQNLILPPIVVPSPVTPPIVDAVSTIVDEEATLPLIQNKSDTRTESLTFDFAQASKKLADLKLLYEKTFEVDGCKRSTHQHQGPRQWRDDKCPICRAKGIENPIDLAALLQQEKEEDRARLEKSLSIDSDYFSNLRRTMKERDKRHAEIAQFNKELAAEKKGKLKNVQRYQTGDLFTHRQPHLPIMTTGDLILGLRNQIQVRSQSVKERSNILRIQDRLECENLRKEMEYTDLKNHLEKNSQILELRNALSAQIHSRRRDELPQLRNPIENPFARSETLMNLYQKEKAKELFDEQMEIVRQRKEYSIRLLAAEKLKASSLLASSRNRRII